MHIIICTNNIRSHKDNTKTKDSWISKHKAYIAMN